MRRHKVEMNGKVESYTNYEDAVKVAKRWRACYEGRVMITDNMTNKKMVLITPTQIIEL